MLMKGPELFWMRLGLLKELPNGFLSIKLRLRGSFKDLLRGCLFMFLYKGAWKIFGFMFPSF